MEYPEVVLGAATSTQEFLIHLYGHLNWHLGQIDYLRRILFTDGVPLRWSLVSAFQTQKRTALRDCDSSASARPVTSISWQSDRHRMKPI